MSRIRVSPLLLVVAALALAAAACSSGSNTTAQAASATPSTTPHSSTTATPTGTSGGCDLPEGTDDHGTEQASGSGTVELVAEDLYFEPTCLTGVAAGTVTVTITNQGKSLHNFKIEDQGIDVDIPAGQTVTVDVDTSGGGQIQFFCKYHSSVGMAGAFYVSG